MTEVVAVDVGGTHARFVIARIDSKGKIRLGKVETLRAANYASFNAAWERFAASHGGSLPKRAAIAIAAPVGDTDRDEPVKLTNNSWFFHRSDLRETLQIEQLTLINDFGAVAHAVAQLDGNAMTHLCGPEGPLPSSGVISILGPGTGLGVAQLVCDGERYSVIETEGGHIDYAPIDAFEDAILARLRNRHRRVSVERVVAGPGLAAIYENLSAIEGRPVISVDDKTLWSRALSGEDAMAVAALDRFCMALGSVTGDIALVHGSIAVVIGGGLGLRLANILPRSGFAQRFADKGRFESRMNAMPVKALTYEQPGLLGAAAAFVQEHLHS